MAKLPRTCMWKSDVMGEVVSDPRIYLLESDSGSRLFWLPYWITFKGKRRYGQFSQIFDQDLFLTLLKQAIANSLFSEEFLQDLKHSINKHLSD